MTLIAGFKTPHDILFRDDLKRWEKNMDVILTVDCAEEDVACHVGLVTQYIPQIQLGDVQNTCLLYTSTCMAIGQRLPLSGSKRSYGVSSWSSNWRHL